MPFKYYSDENGSGGLYHDDPSPCTGKTELLKRIQSTLDNYIIKKPFDSVFFVQTCEASDIFN